MHSERLRFFSAGRARTVILICPSLLAISLHAEPSVPWMPDASTRHDIELLVDEGYLDLVTSQWPLPRAAVVHAIGRLQPGLAPSLERARERVLKAIGLEDVSKMTVRSQNDGEALAGYGDDSTRGSSVSVRSSTVGNVFAVARVGIRVDSVSGLQEQAKLRFDDSAFVTEAFGLELQAFSHRDWWGPGWQGSLTLSNNPPAFDGFGFQRAAASRSDSPWLSWLGPWNYDMFIAQTEDVSDPANPFFFAQRLTFKPFSLLEIGLTRTAQWGGRGRRQSLDSFLNMLTGTGVNADTSLQKQNDSANEEAGFDFRLRCPGTLRCATYIQLTGEDQARAVPTKYLGLYGAEWWNADGNERYFLEYAETGCRSPIGRPFLQGCAYRNYAYPQGYTDAGRWIGSSVGPDSRLLTLGWLDAENGTSIRLSAGRVGSRVGTFSPDEPDPVTSGRLISVMAKRTMAFGKLIVTPELDWFHVAAMGGGTSQFRVGATAWLSLDNAFEDGRQGLASMLSSEGDHTFRPLWLGAGLVAASALLDKGVNNYVEAHAQNPSGRALGKIGKILPVMAFGSAGASWALQHGTAQGDLALSSLEAGVAAAVVTEAGKWVIDRSAPASGEGPYHFGGGARSAASLPSTHTAVTWAVLTPYARAYDAPWLYGLAALTNAGRIASRDHWLSDTVAGSVLGYYLGDLFYRRGVSHGDAPEMQVWIAPRSIHFSKTF